MKSLRNARVLAVVAVAGGVIAAATPALADPPYEPDTTNQLGQITFYDSSGSIVTSGNINDDPFAAYAVASTDDPQQDNTVASLKAYTPVKGVNPVEWSGNALTGPSTFPVTTGPAVVTGAGAHRPVVKIGTSQQGVTTLAGYIADYPNTNSDPAWQGLYQLRIRTANNDPKFWAADIHVDATSGTWTQVYPATTATPDGTVTLTGPHRVGQVDTCVPSISDATDYSYTWLANDAPIAGATGPTYRISEVYYQDILSCSVHAQGPGGEADIANSNGPITVKVGAALTAKMKPYVHHGADRKNAARGVTETVNPGAWKPAATSYSYQWYVGTRKIGGATHRTYKPTKADVGKALSCKVTAHRAAWTNGVARSQKVSVRGS